MLVFDVETTADPTAIPLLPPCEAPGNFRDPETIATAIAERTAERNSRLALDPDCCRIVALGVTDTDGLVSVTLCPDVDVEQAALVTFWGAWSTPGSQPIGYNCVAFDLPVLIQRSRLLDVWMPRITLRKYGSPDCTDLMLDLSHNGLTGYKSLTFWCRRFALDVPEDQTSGKDGAALVAAGQWDTVAAHCHTDVVRTLALARRVHPWMWECAV